MNPKAFEVAEARERIRLAQADADDATSTARLLIEERDELKRRLGSYQALATVMEGSRDQYAAMVDDLICQRDELLVRVDELAAEVAVARSERDTANTRVETRR